MSNEMLFEVEVDLPGHGKIALPLTWKVQREMVKAGLSPKRLYDQAVKSQDLTELDEEAIVRILHIAISHTDKKLTIDEIWEAAFKAGFYNLAVPIGYYLGGFMHGGIPREHKPAGSDGNFLAESGD
jgi:hypothetical protein